MGNPKITLYVDVVSPFAYMAYYMTRHSPIFKPCEITYVPILLGGLFRNCGNRAPLEIKNKDKWIDMERHRWATQFDIPMGKSAPEGFPLNTVQPERTLCALEMTKPELLPIALDTFYQSFWAESNPRTVSDPGFFSQLLESAFKKANASSKDLEIVKNAVANRGTPEVKTRLGDNTDRAMHAGAFGIPWFECENSKGEKDAFWGFDHLGQVVRFLGLDGGNGTSSGKNAGEVRALL